MHSIIVFASGAGSNAQAIINYLKQHPIAKVSLIVCNKPNAGVLDIAAAENIPTLLIDKTSFQDAVFITTLAQYQPSLIVLAGFLWKIPDGVVQFFSNKIINIHPSLLPKYGGKNMYGQRVHQAVIAANEKASGITIHYVNEVYDEGEIIVQAHCSVLADDTPETLAQRVHQLEHYYFPRTLHFLLEQYKS